MVKKDYNLVFNCDYQNSISKRFFYNKITKDYNSYAYVTTFKHKTLKNNHTASQIFTKIGPLAFLPISPVETSVVYSIKGKKDLDLNALIKKHNTKYQILKIKDHLKFSLKSLNLRSYYFKNIIAFGDLLHRLHPLAGQGFNMTIRDIKILLEIIESKSSLGLNLDSSVNYEFEKKSKHKNYIFSNSIDLVHEFFNFERKTNNSFLSKSVQLLNKNPKINEFFTKIADRGTLV